MLVASGHSIEGGKATTLEGHIVDRAFTGTAESDISWHAVTPLYRGDGPILSSRYWLQGGEMSAVQVGWLDSLPLQETACS